MPNPRDAIQRVAQPRQFTASALRAGGLAFPISGPPPAYDTPILIWDVTPWGVTIWGSAGTFVWDESYWDRDVWAPAASSEAKPALTGFWEP